MDNRNDSSIINNRAEEARLTSSSLLLADSQSSPAQQFGRAFAYSALQAPVEGVAQLIDGKANGESQKAVHFLDAPQHAEFGSTSWLAQQAGSGLGAVVPLLLVHKGVSGALSLNYSGKAALALAENMQVLTGSQKLAATSMKLAESGLTGAVYSGLFTPVQNPDENFWNARLRNSASGGLTFATLSASTMGLKSLGERSAASLPLLSRSLSSEVVQGALSGIPAGLVAVNSESLLSGKGFAKGSQQLESALSFSMLGAGFAYGKVKLQGLNPAERTSQAPENFKRAGLDVDGRSIAESARGQVASKLPEYSQRDLQAARSQTIKDLSEIKAIEEGKSVLSQFKDSGLSISQKYRVLNSLAQVREHFANQRANGVIEPDQLGNWVHTLGEFGRVENASRAGKLSAAQTEDAFLASMFADSVKSKANFFTHHMDGALAADHVLQNQFGAGFNRARLDGIVHAIKEHQIGPPEFMSNLYAGRIKAALNFKLNPEQETALALLQSKIADPLNPKNEIVRTADGASVLKLSPQEQALLELSGAKQWYVPEASNPWNKVSRAVIDGDSLDNYFTPGGIGKITGLGGPESDKWFMNRQIDSAAASPDRSTNIGSARASGLDAGKLLTSQSKPIAEKLSKQTESAISLAKEKTAEWLQREKGVDASKETVPFFNADLKYPQFKEHDAKWWNIHRTAADKRTAAEEGFYKEHRFDGLNAKEQQAFLLAKEIRERVANELRAAQRLDGKQPPNYEPAANAGKGKNKR